jgi:hypothetical protein
MTETHGANFDELLRRFCDLDCDRYGFLTTLLEWKNIPYDILSSGGNHILVKPLGHKPFLKDHCRKILTAHYDRVPGTPGANDNAAAVFSLLRHIDLLQSADYPHNTLLLFTDREELLEGSSIMDQGAWRLGEIWPEKQKEKDLFIVFDMCGIGDTLVWGRTAAKLPGIDLKRVASVYDSLTDLLIRYSRREMMDINGLFSDDLGLLLQGMTALQISLLPWKEAREWKASLNRRGDALRTSGAAEASPPSPHELRDVSLPPSWRNNHSPNDGAETLDPRSFHLMDSFLRDLSRYQIPLP